MRYGAVVTLQLLPAWLALDRETRRAKAGRLFDIADAHRDHVAVDWFDADALGNGHSDWLLCRFDDLDRYHALWEELRDDEFFSHPYAEIRQVLLGLHEGYRHYEASLA